MLLVQWVIGQIVLVHGVGGATAENKTWKVSKRMRQQAIPFLPQKWRFVKLQKFWFGGLWDSPTDKMQAWRPGLEHPTYLSKANVVKLRWGNRELAGQPSLSNQWVLGSVKVPVSKRKSESNWERHQLRKTLVAASQTCYTWTCIHTYLCTYILVRFQKCLCEISSFPLLVLEKNTFSREYSPM